MVCHAMYYDTDNNKAVDIVYLDFQIAFNKVPQERLMVTVNAHCIQGDAEDESENR